MRNKGLVLPITWVLLGSYLGKILHTGNKGIIVMKEIRGAADCDQEHPRKQLAPPNYLIT